MKLSGTLLLAALGLTLLATPLLASGPAKRPLGEAARQADPVSRWKAAEHVRQAYPGIAHDLYAQLKARYPDLEHGVVDAVLDTWVSHPDLVGEIAGEVQTRHGQELAVARQDVLAALEASYPDFGIRLRRILAEKGLQPVWQRYVQDYDPGLVEATWAELKTLFPAARGWRPGAFRERILGGGAVLAGVTSLAEMGQGRGPDAARRAVSLMRSRAPGLAGDFTRRWLDGRKELATALRAEFPGAGKIVAETLQAKHPRLVSQLLGTVEPLTREARADLQANLDKRLPGLAAEMERQVASRYPHLRQEILAILID